MDRSELEFRVLGPLAVLRRGSEVALGGPRQRLVLALLVMAAGRAVPAERLIDEIWGEDAPTTGTGPLRTYVWQLRQLFGDAVVSHPAGYLFDVGPDQVDSHRFEGYFAEGRAAAASGQPERALVRLDDALRLWRGPAFGGLAMERALWGEATRLDQLGVGAKELRAELLLATGQHLQVADELPSLARSHPERERLWAMVMTALYRSGRQGDALRCYQEARKTLVEDMGLDPGPELRELEEAILRQDPELEWQPRSKPATGLGETVGGVTERSVLTNLPRQLTSFVGRGAERVEVAEALESSRLVTLGGTGGCGKTRLALAVAEEMQPSFPDGIWFVDLSSVSDPTLIARAMAEPLGVEGNLDDQLELVCRRIAGEQALLVLDNCEHLIELVAKAVEELLERCPALRVLATSREDLRIGAELVWRVPALSLPDEETEPLDSEAVQLFIERGRSALAGFDPEGDRLEAVVQICRRLDGIPLAVELAAALVGSLPVADIAERLDDHLRLLAAERRQGVLRHRTLRATLDWSFDLLDEPARKLFVRLGVFVGDFTLTAAEKVAETEPDPLAVARGLGHLVRTSMVTCVAGSGGAERYRMLETIRQYARERLEELDDAEEVYRRHALYYADFATEAERSLHGPAAMESLERVASARPNLRAAMAWAISRDDVETGVRLARSLQWFFARMALLDEASRWLDVWLARREELSPELRLMALTAAGTVAYSWGEFSRTHELGEEAIVIARQLEDPYHLAVALVVRGGAAVYEGDLARAEECFEEARVLCDRLGDRWGKAWMLTGWATGTRRAGDLERARRQLEEALEIFRSLHDKHGQVLPLVNLALAAQDEGNIEQALTLATEAVDQAISVGERQLQQVSVCVLGRVELSLGRLRRARDLLLHSIRDFHGAHHRLMLAIALEGMAWLTALAGHHRDAVALLGFTKQMREHWQIALSDARAAERDEWLQTARDKIGPEHVEAELERGQGMELDEAVRLAEVRTGSLPPEG